MNPIMQQQGQMPVDPNMMAAQQPMIDPMTGMPIDPNAMAQQPTVDPTTGMPVDANMIEAAQAVDPMTGAPVEPEPPLDTDTSIVRHYMSKPNGATAIQYLQANINEVIAFCNDDSNVAEPMPDGTIKFTNGTGSKLINVGDFIVRDRSKCTIVPPEAFSNKYMMIGDVIPEPMNMDTSDSTLTALTGQPVEQGTPTDPALDQTAENFSISGIVIKKYLKDKDMVCDSAKNETAFDLSKTYNNKYTDINLKRDLDTDIAMYLENKLVESNTPSDKKIAIDSKNLVEEINKSLQNNIHPDFMHNEPSQTLMASYVKPISDIKSL